MLFYYVINEFVMQTSNKCTKGYEFHPLLQKVGGGNGPFARRKEEKKNSAKISITRHVVWRLEGPSMRAGGGGNNKSISSQAKWFLPTPPSSLFVCRGWGGWVNGSVWFLLFGTVCANRHGR